MIYLNNCLKEHVLGALKKCLIGKVSFMHPIHMFIQKWMMIISFWGLYIFFISTSL